MADRNEDLMRAPDNRIAGIIRRIEEFLFTIIILSMILIGLLPVVLRYAGMPGITWTEPLSQHMVLWITFLGAGVAVKERSSISIDALPLVLKPRKRLFLRGLTEFVGTAVCGILAWVSISLIKDTFEFERDTTLFLNIPEWCLMIALPAGFALLALRLLIAGGEDIYHSFRPPVPLNENTDCKKDTDSEEEEKK